VIRAGASETGDVLVFLDRSVDDGKGKFSSWFTAIPAARREMLTVALTAISTGYQVHAYIEDKDRQYSNLLRLYASL
jgi:hypothetical protein